MGKLVLFLLLLVSFRKFCGASNSAAAILTPRDEEEEEEFVPLPPLRDRAVASSSAHGGGRFIDSFMLDETVTVSLNCEKSLGSSERALKSFVMKSLDFEAEETFLDLERPTCRALFDRNGAELTREQMTILMSTERGMRILREGEVLEFFRDFSLFTLEDFDKFPSLQVGKIRELASVPAAVLLSLIRSRGYGTVGKLELIHEKFGDRIFENEVWLLDPSIWQLFTIEGLVQLQNFDETVKFAKFLANQTRFERLLRSIEPEAFLSRWASLLARWSVQSEELMIFLMEMTVGSPPATAPNSKLPEIVEAVDKLVSTRSWLLSELKGMKTKRFGEKNSLYLDNLVALLENPLTWRLREALKVKLVAASGTTTTTTTTTEMTTKLIGVLDSFKSLIAFYSPSFTASTTISNDEILTHFFNVNEIDKLETIFEEGAEESKRSSVGFSVFDAENTSPSTSDENEKLVISISIRRFLLLLLSPQVESSSVIQDALNYVFTAARSPLLTSASSHEVLRWFRQARDLQAVSVLDQLIRNFGHEFNVFGEVIAMMGNAELRLKLFSEANSAYVRLLAALDHTLRRHRTQNSPRKVHIHYVDPANSLLKPQVPPLPVHPLRPASQETLQAHELKISSVKAHNEEISKSLTVSLAFLRTLDACPLTGNPNTEMSGFLQDDFQVNFIDSEGIDAGGLRRTWISALLRIFGDAQRKLFPLHDVGGRVPSALLDPKIMAHLGALHGKALQINVKPDWFFSAPFTQQLLYTSAEPSLQEIIPLIEQFYPDIFAQFDMILQLESEAEAISYFNSSEFPSIEGLNIIVEQEEQEAEEGQEEQGQVVQNDEMDDAQTIIVEDGESVAIAVADSLADTTDAIVNDFETTLSGHDDDDDRTVDRDGQVIGLRLDTFIPPPPPGDDALDPLQLDIARDDSDSDSSDDASSAYSPVTQEFPPPTPPPESSQTNGPQRHSFTRMLVFDVRYLAQESIYRGPRESVADLAGISRYRTALLELFAQNLLLGREAYWRTFRPFFDETFRPRLDPQFLHNLLDTPIVEIGEIMTRIQFHRACDSLLLIDDDSDESEDAEDAENSSLKRARVDVPIKNISAKLAFNRMLSTAFTSPESVNSFLSFTTGCPQIPPAGLDALRITVNCYVAESRDKRFTKSHTCTNAIEFFVSMTYKETRDALKESILSSSGFGFA